jgi:hypothetical protein
MPIRRPPAEPPRGTSAPSEHVDSSTSGPTTAPQVAHAVSSGDALVRAPDGMTRNAHLASSGLSRSQLIERAKLAPVPQRVQIGPTCGLYALGMVMDAWSEKDPKNASALVQKADQNGRGKQYTQEPTTDERILDVAKQKGYTAVGEMFTAADIASTARHFGYDASTHDNATLEDLYKVLDAKHPAIVAFDVDYNGNPTQANGARAHYAVIQGYFDDGGKRYLIARHGWGVQRDHVWEASTFDASWRSLRATDFYGVPGDGIVPLFPDAKEPNPMSLPDLGNGQASISESLATKIVEVVPRGTTLVGGRHA